VGSRVRGSISPVEAFLTRLSKRHLAAFCESLIECGWLLAIVTTPLYFNIYSFRVFEPDKAALLRFIAILVVAAWLIEWLSVPRRGIGDPKRMLQALYRHPLAAPVLFIAFTDTLATGFSVVPRVSLLGSYVRLQGTLTTSAYIVVFMAAATHLRRLDQVKRVIGAVALSSLPITLYALIQHFGLDPLAPWSVDVRERPPANLGNPVFLGGYLAMSTLVVLGLLTAQIRRASANYAAAPARIGVALAYGVVLTLNLVAMLLTESRGPQLALYIGLVCYLCLATTVPVVKRPAMIALLVLVVAPIFVGVRAVRGGTVQQAQEHIAARWASALDVGHGSVGVRIAIWKGVIDLVTTKAALELPDGRRDAWRALRPVIGYGPESLPVTFRIAAQPDLARLEGRPVFVDRAHNETLDILATTGVLGVIGYLWLFAAIVWRGLKSLGWLGSRRVRSRLSFLALTCSVVTAIMLTAWQGLALLVIAIPLGAVFGLLLYLGLSVLSRHSHPVAGRVLPGDASIVLISLLSATIAHFIEINFGVATVATRTHFWLIAALLALDVTTLVPEVESRVPSKTPLRQKAEREAPRWMEASVAGLLVAAVLATLAHDYFVFDIRTAPWGRLFVESAGGVPAAVPSWPALGLFAVTWLIGCFVALDTMAPRSGRSFGAAGWFVPVLSMAIGGVCWLERGKELNGIVRSAPTDIASMLVLGERVTRLSDHYVALLAVLGFALASALPAVTASPAYASESSSPLVHDRCTVWDLCKFSVVGAVALWLVQIVCLRPIQADTLYNVARQTRPDQRELTIGLYHQAIAVAFHEDQYALEAGQISSK
jgi:hypothetical protein